MRIQYLQHVPFEGPGYFSAWALQNGHELNGTMLFDGHALPETDAFDLLLVLGGPMNVYDDARYPWLTAEKRFLSECIEQGKAVIGICLGAQLLALVLGAKISPNTENEIGWFPVQNTEFPGIPFDTPVFHWHGDTFGLPDGACHLYQSQACANQGFVYGNNVLGLQFHPEATPASIRQMLQYGEDEDARGPFVQHEEQILAGLSFCGPANAGLERLLAHFLGGPATD